MKMQSKIHYDNQDQQELVCLPKAKARLKGLDPLLLLPVVTGFVLRSIEQSLVRFESSEAGQ